jgi:GABA(A) receptor-associated protein
MGKIIAPLKDRLRSSKRIRERFPDKIPVIVKTDLHIDKNRFLIGGDATMGEFQHTVRRYMTGSLRDSDGLFFFINNTIPATSRLMSFLWKEYGNEDGFLYIECCQESVFG